MHFDWWTLGLQTVNVLVLLWILSRFLFRPVAAMIAARQAEAARLLDDAQAARAAAEAERAQAAGEAQKTAAARAAVLQAAAAEADAARTAGLAAAGAEADRLRVAAAADMERAKREQAAAADARAARLAVDIAARVMRRLPESARVNGFIDGLAEGIAALPASSRADLAAGGAPVRLAAPRALDAGETAACREALARVLGRPVEIVVDVVPDLIAGLELRAEHAVVRNSLKADLDRIAAALKAEADGAGGSETKDAAS